MPRAPNGDVFDTVLGPSSSTRTATPARRSSRSTRPTPAADGKGDWVFDKQVDFGQSLSRLRPEQSRGAAGSPALSLLADTARIRLESPQWTAPPRSQPTPRARRVRRAPNPCRLLIVVAVLLVVSFLLLGVQQFLNALTLGAIYALIALGYTMVYGIIELINFAHGDVFMVGAFVSLWILTVPSGFNAARSTTSGLLAVVLLVVVRCHDGRHGRRRRHHRAVRLSAAAPRAAPRAADHGDRRLVHPPERHPDVSPSPSPINVTPRSSRPA